MKRANLMIAIVMAMAIAFLPSLYAQPTQVELKVPGTTSLNGTLQVYIPFAFSVDGKILEAGDYYILPTGEKGITIKDVAARKTVVVLTNPVTLGTTMTAPKLVFHRYGDKNFLAQTFLRHSDQGREFYASADEIRSAREYKQVTVEVAVGK